jgi:hypothetical protein
MALSSTANGSLLFPCDALPLRVSGLVHARTLRRDFVYPVEGIRIPRRTTGVVVVMKTLQGGSYVTSEVGQDPAESDNQCVCRTSLTSFSPGCAVTLKWKHSAWRVLFARFSSIAAHLLDECAGAPPTELLEEVVSTLGLLSAVLEHAPCMLRELCAHLKVRLVAARNRFSPIVIFGWFLGVFLTQDEGALSDLSDRGRDFFQEPAKRLSEYLFRLASLFCQRVSMNAKSVVGSV